VAAVPFVSWQTPGGAGVAAHRLTVTLPDGPISFGPSPLRSGQIVVHQ
jgi:hypothetical protein